MKQGSKVKRLCVSAIMLALATVLSLVKIYTLPLGGSITLLSMLPIVFLSVNYGLGWGFFSAFVYSLIQFALDFASIASWGLTPAIFVGCIVFDYVLAYTALGIAGIDFSLTCSQGLSCLEATRSLIRRFYGRFATTARTCSPK